MPFVLLGWALSALASGMYVGHSVNQAVNRKRQLAKEEAEAEPKRG